MSVFDQAFLTDNEQATEILMIRHAQPDNKPDVPVGELVDPPLTELGRAQAELVGRALSTQRIDAIFSSPLKRAYETAQAVAHHHKHLALRVVPDLREIELFRDVPQDQRVADFVGRELLLGVRHRMLSERSWDVYPYSEPSRDFLKRSINAVEQVIATNIGNRIVIVCHGGVINAYIGHIIRSPYDMFFRPAHTSINTVVAGEGRRVLRLLNDTHHLIQSEHGRATY